MAVVPTGYLKAIMRRSCNFNPQTLNSPLLKNKNSSVHLVMSRQLDRLIKKYNQSKMQVVKSIPRRKTYSEEVVDEKEVEELIEAIAENSKELEEAEKILNKTTNTLEESEAPKFIAGALALTDKLIIDKIGDQEFKNGIVTIDLKKLKWIAYKSKPLIAKFVGFVKDLIKTEKKITQENIGHEMFDSYVSVMKLKALAEAQEASQDGKELNSN